VRLGNLGLDWSAGREQGSASRVASRRRWLSDTVAGSALGYAIGKVLWESACAPQKGAPSDVLHKVKIVETPANLSTG
jgi:hypothetical protein